MASSDLISLTGGWISVMTGTTSDGGALLIRQQLLGIEDNREAVHT
jgi:hypothetical protein